MINVLACNRVLTAINDAMGQLNISKKLTKRYLKIWRQKLVFS